MIAHQLVAVNDSLDDTQSSQKPISETQEVLHRWCNQWSHQVRRDLHRSMTQMTERPSAQEWNQVAPAAIYSFTSGFSLYAMRDNVQNRGIKRRKIFVTDRRA